MNKKQLETEYNCLLDAYIKLNDKLNNPELDRAKLLAHINHLEEELKLLQKNYNLVCERLKELER